MTRSHWHCGHPATPENTKPGKKGHRCLRCIEKTAVRDRQMAAEYLGGSTRRQLAEKYDLHIQTVSKILRKQSARLSSEEQARRTRAARSPHCGRRTVWPDCPPHLKREYMRFRNHYGIPAAEARAMLEAVA